jgi:hypothetical protein
MIITIEDTIFFKASNIKNEHTDTFLRSFDTWFTKTRRETGEKLIYETTKYIFKD